MWGKKREENQWEDQCWKFQYAFPQKWINIHFTTGVCIQRLAWIIKQQLQPAEYSSDI